MRDQRLSIGLKATLPVIFTAILFVTNSYAGTEKVLHSFNEAGVGGANPVAGLIFDAAGNLYATTEEGGTSDLGTVFELTLAASGGWTHKLLHTFDGAGGSFPQASLIFDDAGNLYGTTNSGGAYGGGIVFELTPTAGGGWAEDSSA
jgi:uncharacterized repeat protein (TIGR03803 family)